MAVRTWPTEPAFCPVQPDGITMTMRSPKSALAGFYTGNRWTSGHLADRLQFNLVLPPCDAAAAGRRRAFFTELLTTGDRVRFADATRLQPRGTLTGAPVVASAALAGARSVQLANSRAGGNLLRAVDSMSTFLASGWTLVNATMTGNAAAGPSGAMDATVLTRTASGNHYAIATHTLATTATRTITAVVWLKAGTLTGDVALRLRDGAGVVDRGSRVVTPTAGWNYYTVSATFPAGTAANVQLYVDPANDAGSAGDTLLMWYCDIRVSAAFDTNCTAWAEKLAPPAGMAGLGVEIVRTATANAYSAYVHSTTAHANRTYTFSTWLQAGTYNGACSLFLRDGAGNQVGATTVPSLSAGWTRWQVSGTFGAAPAGDIVAFLDPGEGGPVGETFGAYGAVLNLGGAPVDFQPWPTLQAGDWLSAGNRLLMVGSDGAVGDVAGTITVPLARQLLADLGAGTSVAWDSPAGDFELLADELPFQGGFGAWQRRLNLTLLEV